MIIEVTRTGKGYSIELPEEVLELLSALIRRVDMRTAPEPQPERVEEAERG